MSLPTPADHRRGASFILSTLAVALFAILALGTGAQEVDALMRGFAPTGDFEIEIDGTRAEGAKLYLAERPQAYLIIDSSLGGPLLLELRRGTVSRVNKMKLLRRDNGTIDMVADANPRALGRYQLDGRAVVVSVDDKTVKMVEKPPLVGLHDRDSLVEHSPGYQRSADAYTPNPDALGHLQSAGGNVRVRTYFGSWCPHCKRHVPFMMRVEKELAEAGITFEYFGLPKPGPGAAPWPEKVGNVPTAIVYVDGREVGRVKDNAWRAPEITLDRLVTGQADGR